MTRSGHTVLGRPRREGRVIALAGVVALLLLLLLALLGPVAPAGAAGEAYAGAPTSVTIDLIGGPAVTSSTVSSGSVDAAAGTFTASLGQAGGVFPFTPPGYQNPFDIQYGVVQATPATGTIDAGAGTATLTSSLVFSLSVLADESGGVIVDLSPCRFTVPVTATGTYDPVTGIVDVTDGAVTVAPTADSCAGDIQKNDLNNALAGTGRAVHLVLDLPSPDAPPELTSLTPDHGPAGTLVHLVGTELRDGATTVHFGSATIDPADVDVSLGGNAATFTVPGEATAGAYAVTASTTAGTSDALTFVVQAVGPSPVTGSATFGTNGPVALRGEADSVLISDGKLTTHLVFASGSFDWSTPPGGEIESTGTLTYDLAQTGGGRGSVDATAGTAVLDVTVQLRARISEISFLGGGAGTGMYYRYPIALHLVGTYDEAGGEVALTADPVSIPPTNDQGEYYPEDIERQFGDGVLTGTDNTVSVRFTLPPAVDPPPVTTTTTTTTTAPPTTTTSTTTTMTGSTTTIASTTTTTVAASGGGSGSSATTTTTEATPGAPTVDSVTPSEAAPGTVVTVTGANFVVGGTTVELGGVSVPADVSPDRLTGSHLTFVVPDDAPTGVNELRVVSAGGTSATQPFTVIEAAPPATVASDSTPGAVPTIVTTGPIVSPRPGTQEPDRTGSGLARTGAPLVFVAGLGMALLVAGMAASALSRRRGRRV